ncbi:putative mitochondrial protein [Vitis vinifera]|uniref:Putative mitochondrial protein n=1 Tax=Vitis vinifera TaxID=29760 RepID=A0A438I3Y8_VITVI|nr:putative mitochondrial protein [Vitis vinifera]
MATAHRRVNSLDRIKINGVWLSEEQEVREGVANAFQQLLSENSDWKADIEGLHLKQISQQKAELLELLFPESEVLAGLMDMNGDKALGSDGFTVAFWQSCRDFVKEEILDMFKEFHEQSSFIRSLNNMFLVFLLKKRGAEDLGDYRPIGLLGGLYKLLAKVLASRLKKVIGKVVSPRSECVCFAKNGVWAEVAGMDVELYIYSQVFSFGERSTSRVLPSSKGLRQGDPLSPYLFVMGMEVLSALIRRAIEGDFISGCNIWRGRRQTVNISHLLFADDTVVFCEAKKEYITHLSWILFWFEAASGLRINLAKSEILPVGEVEEVDEMAVELGCRVGQLPAVYLGLPFGGAK